MHFGHASFESVWTEQPEQVAAIVVLGTNWCDGTTTPHGWLLVFTQQFRTDTFHTTPRTTTITMGEAATLYRSILRAHKAHLPLKMRSLGDTYVRAEFHRHKTADTQPEHVQRFYTEWEGYLHQILTQSTSSGSFGKDLPQDVALTEDQKAQLDKLRHEAANANKSN